jgi:hypothetical protein
MALTVSHAPSDSLLSFVITLELVGEPRDVPRLRHFLILQDACPLWSGVFKSCTALLGANRAWLLRLALNASPA